MLKLVSDNGSARNSRRALLAKVHIAKKALGLQDDDYRAIIVRVTGKCSAGDLSIAQLEALLAEFERLGFQPVRSIRRAPRATHATAQKARALWISLFQLGAIADPSDSALEAFAKRQLKVDRLQWADQSRAYPLIEALKAIAERHGWPQKLPARISSEEGKRILKNRLIDAQLRKLAAAGYPIEDNVSGDRSSWSVERLLKSAEQLGELIHLLPLDERR